MREKKIEIIEVYKYCDDNEKYKDNIVAFDFNKQKNLKILKIVALIANGEVIKLYDDFVAKKRIVDKEYYKKLLK